MRASFVVEARADGAPVAFVLTTTLGPGTAHIAQVAVDPQWGRRGIGRSLVRLAASAAAADGMRRLTLLVSAENTPASCLYQAEGFDEIGRFVFASRFTPVRRQMTRRRAA
jgi:ribosomal protein S18 acetylase RimI-like enzyme